MIWFTTLLTTYVGHALKRRAQQRAWRVYSFWTFFAVVLLIVAYLAVLTRFYSGDGFSNLMRILYANVCLIMAAHHACVHLATRSPSARAWVDAGFRVMDAVCGALLLAVLGFLSLLGIVAWAQVRKGRWGAHASWGQQGRETVGSRVSVM